MTAFISRTTINFATYYSISTTFRSEAIVVSWKNKKTDSSVLNKLKIITSYNSNRAKGRHCLQGFVGFKLQVERISEAAGHLYFIICGTI